uniref:hypothetical protein n=1 Tax=Salmonella sp. TaxID=599 RepID=UPI001CD95B26|nr:hypothetical protein [Salmonella sp.]
MAPTIINNLTLYGYQPLATLNNYRNGESAPYVKSLEEIQSSSWEALIALVKSLF